MKHKPRNPGQGIFINGSAVTLVVYGFFIGFITLAAFLIGREVSIEKGRTMAFATLCLSQLFHVFNFRSLRNSLLIRGLKSNIYLIGAALTSTLLLITVMVIPYLERVFKLADLNTAQWLTVVGLGASTILLAEIWKIIWVRRHVEG